MMPRNLHLLSLLLTTPSLGFVIHTTPLSPSETQLSMGYNFPSLNNPLFDHSDDGMHPLNNNNNDNNHNNNHNNQEDEEAPFLQGDALHHHRRRIWDLRQSLANARHSNDRPTMRQITRAILAAQARDAEYAYACAPPLSPEATHARAFCPQFQLEGLWVGKYGDTFQMVNVSYVGDMLVAHKVTGRDEDHVPKGQVSFRVDLQPHPAGTSSLDPIELQPEAADQWGAQFLQRHAGQGQVAGRGYIGSQWMEGQLILVNRDYFSFAWLETGHQVFFGRPSPELTLKLLRQQQEVEGASADALYERRHLERCLEETECLDDEMEISDGIFQSHEQDFYYNKDGFFD